MTHRNCWVIMYDDIGGRKGNLPPTYQRATASLLFEMEVHRLLEHGAEPCSLSLFWYDAEGQEQLLATFEIKRNL
jgi:hypothetical protein